MAGLFSFIKMTRMTRDDEHLKYYLPSRYRLKLTLEDFDIGYDVWSRKSHESRHPARNRWMSSCHHRRNQWKKKLERPTFIHHKFSNLTTEFYNGSRSSKERISPQACKFIYVHNMRKRKCLLVAVRGHIRKNIEPAKK